MVAGDGQPNPDPPPGNNAPDWCKCRNCVMSTQEENKCCSRTVRPCISTTPLFLQLVLDPNVLDLAMRFREDFLVLSNVRNNENFRHAAYRQYMSYGSMVDWEGQQKSCSQLLCGIIRACYPSPNGMYTGYRPARL